MADSLTVSIGADATKLRAELAVAQSEMRAFSREMNAAANVARKAGDDLSFAKVGQAASQFDRAAASVTKLKTELGEASKASQGFVAGFDGMRRALEAAGAIWAVDKIVEYVKRMGELGERTVYMGAATGRTPYQFSLLTGALRLAGGEAEHASRTIEILGTKLQEALTTKTSSAAKAAASLGISQEELRKASTDTGYALDLLADKWVKFQDDLTKSTDFRELLGRGFEVLIPLLSRGSAGMEEFKAKAAETGIVLSNQEARALADTGEKVHELSLTLEGAGVRGFIAMKGAIDTAISGLSSFITMAHDALAAVTGVDTAAEHAAAIRRAKGLDGGRLQATTGPGGYWGMRSGKMRWNAYPTIDPVPGDNLNFTMPPEDLGQRDFGGGGDAAKPKAAPWPDKPVKSGGSKGAAPITSAFDLADSAAQAQIRIDTSYLSTFKSNLEAMKDAKQITVAQMLGFDIQYTAKLETQDQARLASAMAAADAIVVKTDADAAKQAAARLKVWEQEMELSARAAALIAQDQKKIADDAAKTAEAWAAPFKKAIDAVGSTFEPALTGLIDRSKTLQQTWADIAKSATGAGIGLIGSIASKGAASFLGATGGKGLGDFLGDKVLSMLGLGQQPEQAANTAALTANTSALTTLAATMGGAGATALNPLAGAAGNAAGGGGFLSSLFGTGGLFGSQGAIFGTAADASIAGGGAPLALPFLAFAKGGIVPSAAGGWNLPSFAGMQPALLHSREMVLPAHLADAVRAGAQGGAGEVHLHSHFHGPADAPGIARFFRDNQDHIARAVQSAFRSNRLTPNTF